MVLISFSWLCECVEGEISILLMIPLIGIQFLECSLFFLLETINPFRSQNPASPPSVLKILQPPFRFQNPVNPPPLPPPKSFASVLTRYSIFPFPFYLPFHHCQLEASSFGETLGQFLTRLKNEYHWTDQGRLGALMKELNKKRRITTVRTLRAIWEDINSELSLSIGIKITLEKEFKRM